jgi:hypothetical protein
MGKKDNDGEILKAGRAEQGDKCDHRRRTDKRERDGRQRQESGEQV